jgi:hypothetical protein
MIESCLLVNQLKLEKPECDIVHYHKDGNDFTILWEFNASYGPICRQWIVNGNNVSDMDHKYFDDRKVIFDCSCSLIGVEPFEKNSIVWETLAKPLGLDFEFDRLFKRSVEKYRVDVDNKKEIK